MGLSGGLAGVMEFFLAVAGAGLGSVLRFAIGGWVSHRLGAGFPWGTLAANTIGCLLLGVLKGLVPENPALILILGAGLLAGLTTFSTLVMETANLGLSGRRGRALLNLALNLAVGLPAFLAGLYAGLSLGGGG